MVAEVIIDRSTDNIDRIFEYTVFEEVSVGSQVIVSFANKFMYGYIIKLKEESEFKGTLKGIEKVVKKGLLSPESIHIARYMADKYNLRMIDAINLFTPPGGGKIKESLKKCVEINPDFDVNDYKKPDLKTSQIKARDIILYLEKEKEEYKSVLLENFGTAVNTLIKKNVLIETNKTVRRAPKTFLEKTTKIIKLTKDQKECIEDIKKGGLFLLHGVTGSGKTEVYMQVIEENLKQGKNAIVLVPEISLTTQVYEVFQERFPNNVAIIHSKLSTGERFDEWNRIYNGEVGVVIGARSAIFSPLKNIGIIVVDEEHDSSYTSETNPRYDAKEIALFRAKNNSATLILASATPSIETYYLAKNNKLKLLTLQNRINDLNLPEIEVIDMKKEVRHGNISILSYSLREAISEALEKNEQIMLYLNRRGHSSFVLCRNCGNVIMCPDCDISLTYHLEDKRLKCHYCDKKFYMVDKCPVCTSSNLQLGKIGTEKLVQELKIIYPTAKILRMDKDSTAQKDGHNKIVSAFHNKEADILVGTQMITKGHDFSNVTLVGILDADSSLFLSDYRCNERTFQQITQVAGRAGREKKPGRVILQTFAPDHRVLVLAKRYDYKRFYDIEINTREVTKYPPFTIILRILITSKIDDNARDITQILNIKVKDLAAQLGGFVYLTAMRSPINRLQEKYRYQILARIKNDENVDDTLKKIYDRIDDILKNKDKIPVEKLKDLTIFTEINPQTLI